MSMRITPDATVGSVMESCPGTLAVFLRNRMHCPGCVMARLMTLAEAAESHGIDAGKLLDELRAAVPAGKEDVS